jgi:hypothetical protein
MGGACGTYRSAEVNTEFWWVDLMERHHLEDIGIDGRIILKCNFRKWDREAWTGLLWLRIRTVNLRIP